MKKTYNFEVEDNHNYYVSDSCVLVHNECHHIISNKGKRGNEIAEKVRKKYKSVDLNDKRNLVEILDHKGRHTNAYHNMINDVVDYLTDKIDDINEFYNEFIRLGVLIQDNNDCLKRNHQKICDSIYKKFMRNKKKGGSIA